MLDETGKSCVPCGLHQPLRNHYFDGKFLTARDFSDEQDYHRGHRHMHNALLHGTGTVCGLRLIQHPAPDCRRAFVVVEPGLALDCCGQEIVVPARALVRVRELIAADSKLQAALDGEHDLLIAIERRDAGAEPVPMILPGCDGEGGTTFGRIAEGYAFRLLAARPGERPGMETPINPKLDWVHSFVLEASLPRAVHVNSGERLVQITADDSAGRARTYAHDLDTHDLVALLGGAVSGSDTGSAREARLIFVAGDGFDVAGTPTAGIGVWQAATVRERPDPVAVIPTRGRQPRIAVSPASGTLYVLDIDGADSRLVSYTSAAITDWLPAPTDPVGTPPAGTEPAEQQSLAFGHGFGGPDDAAGRGAAMLEISRDGRFLAVASPDGAAAERLYLIDTASFAGGGMTAAMARASGYEPGADERLEAVRWSFDDAYLYVLSRETETGGAVLLDRYELVDTGPRLVKSGRGVRLEGTAFDLALAPTERRAYLLLADPGGVTRLTTVDLEQVKSLAAAEPEPVGLSPDAIRLDGQGRSLTLTPNGNRLYAAVADDPAAQPERGLVAVVDIAEVDCGIRFDRQVDGCPACADDGHAVILGHVAGYVWDPEDDGPRLMDAAEAEAGDLVLDNLAYRRIVPSAVVLREVVECILAQGVAEGPPGPRGDPGFDGEDGLSIDTVEVTAVGPADPATGSVAPNETGLTLQLDIPRGQDGAQGPNGRSITQVVVNMLPPGSAPTGSTSNVGATAMRLTLGIPQAEGAAVPTGNPILAMSWAHGELYPGIGSFPEFMRLLVEQGIAIAFERPVAWKFVTGTERAGRTMVAELQVPIAADRFRMVTWNTLHPLIAHPIADLVIDGTLLRDWTRLDGADESPGLCLRSPEPFELPIAADLPVRFVLYADFAVDRDGVAVDGTHLAGQLPTGKSAGGGTFRSWFRHRRQG